MNNFLWPQQQQQGNFMGNQLTNLQMPQTPLTSFLGQQGGQQTAPTPFLSQSPMGGLAMAPQQQFMPTMQFGMGQFQRGGDFLPMQDVDAVPPPTTPGMSTQDMLGFGLGAATLGLGLWDAKSQIDLGKGQLGVARDTLDLKKRMYSDRKGAADAVQFAPR